jgi:DsbC/DsbD-like thiol-disulfide interchange protein
MTAVRIGAVVAGVLGILCTVPPAVAQTGRPMPTFHTSVVSAHIQPGGKARLRLRVELPEGLHVQSDKPRDPALVPTSLTFSKDGPVSVLRTTYPKATDLAQPGLDEPLAVFSGTFDIDVEVSVSPTARPGALEIPGQLRYQSCTAEVCFPPARAALTWHVKVGAATAAR